MRAQFRFFTLAALLVASAASGLGQQQPPPPPPVQQPPAQQPPADPQQRPTIRTGINFVRVDVIVSDDDGNPILDLKPEDFTVTEDGKAQKIESFSVVKIDQATQLDNKPPSAIRSEADVEREAARPDVRMFVILLDDYHVRRGNDMAVRKPLIDFIQNSLAPADLVAIMYPLTPVDDIQFSRNRSSLVSAIEKFEGRKFIYEPRNAFEERYAFYPAATVERIRNQVTLSALQAAAMRMAGLREGRKSVILVSEGLTKMLPTQLNDPVAAMPGMGNPNRRNPNAPQPTDMQQLQAQSDLNYEMRIAFDTLNRQNTSVYSVDPRGLAVFEYGIEQSIGLEADRQGLQSATDTLRVLADNTDGRAIVNRNDLAAGMKQIVRDASGYYLLGYNSTQAPTDGKFHEIKVNVKRRGVDVRARKGYWALTADEAAAATAPPKPEAPTPIREALSTLAEPPGGRPARFWIGTARGAAEKARVTFVWEAEPITQTSRHQDPVDRVALTAYGGDGTLLYRGRLPDPEVAAAAKAAGAPLSRTAGTVSFDAPPGQVQLRVVAEGARGEVIDSVTREITVPDYGAVQVSLGTPRVYSARTPREMNVIKGNAEATPTAERDFSRTERLLVRVDAYAPGSEVPALTARLLNRGGSSMADLPVQKGSTGHAEIDLPLAALAPGEYLIEINAKTGSGTAQEFIAFKVGR